MAAVDTPTEKEWSDTDVNSDCDSIIEFSPPFLATKSTIETNVKASSENSRENKQSSILKCEPVIYISDDENCESDIKSADPNDSSHFVASNFIKASHSDFENPVSEMHRDNFQHVKSSRIRNTGSLCISISSSSSDSDDSLPPLSIRMGFNKFPRKSSEEFPEFCVSDINTDNPNGETIDMPTGMCSDDEFPSIFKLAPNKNDGESLSSTESQDILTHKAYTSQDPMKAKIKHYNSQKNCSSQERQLAKEKRKKEREFLQEERRELKKRQKEKEKLLAKARHEANNSEHPKECHKFLTTVFDKSLAEIKNAAEMLNILDSLGIKYSMESQKIPGLITWRRQLVENIIIEDNLETNKVTKEVEQDHALIYIPVKDFVQMIHAFKAKQYGLESADETTLLSYYQECHKIVQKKLTFLVFGIESYLKSQKKKVNRDFRCAVSGLPQQSKQKRKDTSSAVSKLEVDEATVSLQIEENGNIIFVESIRETANLICHFSRAIAEAPYKQCKSRQHGFSWYIEGDNVGTVKVSADGHGLSALWQQQLQQFNNVTKDVSQAIVAKYPTPQSLIQAYKQLPPQRAVNLLKDIVIRRGAGPLATTRNIGQELSRKIYMIFNETNPNVLLKQSKHGSSQSDNTSSSQ